MRRKRHRVGPRGRLIGRHSRRGRRRVRQEPVCPRNEILPVRSVRVPAVMLTPRQLAVEQSGVHRRHLLGHVVVGNAEPLRTEQAEHGLRRDCGHVAALLIQPFGVTPFGHAVADESGARGAQGEKLVRIDRNIASGLSAERRLFGAVLHEVAGHPVVLARPGEAFNRFAEIAAMQLGPAFAGRTNQDDRKALVVRHRHQRGLAEPRHAFDPDLLRIDSLVGLQVVEPTRGTPRPGPKRAPIVRAAPLAFVDQPDDALRQSGAVVRLDAAWCD